MTTSALEWQIFAAYNNECYNRINTLRIKEINLSWGDIELYMLFFFSFKKCVHICDNIIIIRIS